MTLRIAQDLELPLEELAWAAGVFEGEGTIAIAVRKSDETYRLVCMVGSTDRQMVDFFHARWGGWLQPAYGERPGRQPAWYWTVAGPRAAQFLFAVRPHFRTDRVRRKAELGLRFKAHQTSSKRVWREPSYKVFQRDCYLEMKELNRRGLKEVSGG